MVLSQGKSKIAKGNCKFQFGPIVKASLTWAGRKEELCLTVTRTSYQNNDECVRTHGASSSDGQWPDGYGNFPPKFLHARLVITLFHFGPSIPLLQAADAPSR